MIPVLRYFFENTQGIKGPWVFISLIAELFRLLDRVVILGVDCDCGVGKLQSLC